MPPPLIAATALIPDGWEPFTHFLLVGATAVVENAWLFAKSHQSCHEPNERDNLTHHAGTVLLCVVLQDLLSHVPPRRSWVTPPQTLLVMTQWSLST
jgi:hypothetical protein